MKAYILGGAKNGKSTLAQNLAVLCSKYEGVSLGSTGAPDGDCHRARELPLYYVATMVPTDDEDRARISRHREERAGLGFTTVERAKDLSGILEPDGDCSPHGVYLVDSVTALLSNVMFPPNAAFNPNAAEAVKKDLEIFLSKVDHAIFVSDYIYADPIAISGRTEESNGHAAVESDAEDYTGTYIMGLANIDRKIARLCDQLIEVSAGIARVIP